MIQEKSDDSSPHGDVMEVDDAENATAAAAEQPLEKEADAEHTENTAALNDAEVTASTDVQKDSGDTAEDSAVAPVSDTAAPGSALDVPVPSPTSGDASPDSDLAAARDTETVGVDEELAPASAADANSPPPEDTGETPQTEVSDDMELNTQTTSVEAAAVTENMDTTAANDAFTTEKTESDDIPSDPLAKTANDVDDIDLPELTEEPMETADSAEGGEPTESTVNEPPIDALNDDVAPSYDVVADDHSAENRHHLSNEKDGFTQDTNSVTASGDNIAMTEGDIRTAEQAEDELLREDANDQTEEGTSHQAMCVGTPEASGEPNDTVQHSAAGDNEPEYQGDHGASTDDVTEEAASESQNKNEDLDDDSSAQQDPPAAHDDTAATHDDTAATHDDTAAAHDDTAAAHDDTATVHDDAAADRDNTADAHAVDAIQVRLFLLKYLVLELRIKCFSIC